MNEKFKSLFELKATKLAYNFRFKTNTDCDIFCLKYLKYEIEFAALRSSSGWAGQLGIRVVKSRVNSVCLLISVFQALTSNNGNDEEETNTTPSLPPPPPRCGLPENSCVLTKENVKLLTKLVNQTVGRPTITAAKDLKVGLLKKSQS